VAGGLLPPRPSPEFFIYRPPFQIGRAFGGLLGIRAPEMSNQRTRVGPFPRERRAFPGPSLRTAEVRGTEKQHPCPAHPSGADKKPKTLAGIERIFHCFPIAHDCFPIALLAVSRPIWPGTMRTGNIQLLEFRGCPRAPDAAFCRLGGVHNYAASKLTGPLPAHGNTLGRFENRKLPSCGLGKEKQFLGKCLCPVVWHPRRAGRRL